MKKNIVNTTLIRFDQQSAFRKGYNEKNPREYIEKLGMKILKYSYSSYGACFFIEVENYTEDPNNIYVKIEADPLKFDWDSY
jgi:hypothetical protein